MYPQMKLDHSSIQALKPKGAPYKVFDGGGLYLFVHPSGSKRWRLKYRWAGKESSLSFGGYPDVSVEQARVLAEDARNQLKSGINPAEHAKCDQARRQDELARQVAATRFMLEHDGALSFRLGRRTLCLTPAETSELRSFLDATRAVTPKE